MSNVNNEARAFGIYVLSLVLPRMVGVNTDYKIVMTRLSAFVPTLDVSKFHGEITETQWQTEIAPKIVDHFAALYNPNLRATA